MAANVQHLAADSTPLTAYAFADAVAGQNQMPIKFGFQNVGDRVLRNTQIAPTAFGQNDGINEIVVALDSVTLSAPYGVAATLTAAGAGGVWGSTGTKGFRITAINATGETIGSVEITVNVDVSTKGVVLVWTQIPGATGYKVYDTDTSGTYPDASLRTTIGNGATTTYTDLGGARSAGKPPATNTTAGWLVTAAIQAPGAGVWTSGGVRYYRTAAFDSTGALLAVTVEGSVSLSATNTPVLLSWSSVSGAAYYQLYRSLVSGLYNSPAAVGGTTLSVSLLDTGLATGTGSVTAAASYGIPPLASAFATPPILTGDIAIGKQQFYWVNRVVSAATPETGNPRVALIAIKET